MQHPKPQHDSVCDALGCGVSCPIAAMREALEAARALLAEGIWVHSFHGKDGSGQLLPTASTCKACRLSAALAAAEG